LEAAEELAIAASQSDDPDAPWIFVSQIGLIRWEPGPSGGIIAGVREMAAQPGVASGFEAGNAAILATVGAVDEARLIFDRKAAEGFSSVPWDASWPVTMALWGQAAQLLEARPEAGEGAALLLPWEGRFAWDSVTSYGPIAYFLGELERMIDDE